MKDPGDTTPREPSLRLESFRTSEASSTRDSIPGERLHRDIRSQEEKLHRKIPSLSVEEVRRGFLKLDRNSGDWLSKMAFFQGAQQQGWLQNLLGACFGEALFHQTDEEDLEEDLDLIFSILEGKRKGDGEVSVQQFIAGLRRAAKMFEPLPPPLPVPTTVEWTWAMLARRLRHKLADVPIHQPLSALWRLRKQAEAIDHLVQTAPVAATSMEIKNKQRAIIAQSVTHAPALINGATIWVKKLEKAELLAAASTLACIDRVIRHWESLVEDTRAHTRRTPQSWLGFARAALRTALHERGLSWLSSNELAVAGAAVFSAPAAEGKGAEAALERRTLARAIAACTQTLWPKEIGLVSAAVAEVGYCEPELSVAVAFRLEKLAVGLGGVDGRLLKDCELAELSGMCWVVAQHRMRNAVDSTILGQPDNHERGQHMQTASQSAVMLAAAATDLCCSNPVSWLASRRVGQTIVKPASESSSSQYSQQVSSLAAGELARLCWALGQIGSWGAAGPLPEALGAEFLSRSAFYNLGSNQVFNGSELTQIVWGLAALGWKPPSVEEVKSLSAAAVKVAPRLAASELTQLLEAFGMWGTFGSRHDLQKLADERRVLIETLRNRSGDLTGTEILSVLRALLRLDLLPDPELIGLLESRAKAVGPFEPKSAGELQHCLRRMLQMHASAPCAPEAAALAKMSSEHGVAALLHGNGNLAAMTRLLSPEKRMDNRLEHLMRVKHMNAVMCHQ